MTARQRLNEMEQFMEIARGNLPKKIINEVRTIEFGGQQFPMVRVPIEFYNEFKAQFPGSRIRFRGPRHGKAHTSKRDATHFYIERQAKEAPIQRPKPEGIRPPHRPEDRPHTPGYNNQNSGGREAANSRAQAFIFDDINNKITEGAWALPKTKEAFGKLHELLKAGIPNAQFQDQIYNLLGDDTLFDRLDKLDPDGIDGSQVTIDWMKDQRTDKYSNFPAIWNIYQTTLRKEVAEDENDARGKMCPVCTGGRREGYGNDCPNCGGEGYVTEDNDAGGMGRYDVTVETDDSYYPDELETALPYDEAYAFAEKYVKDMFAGGAERVEQWKKGDGVEWTGIDHRGNSFFVKVIPTEDADAEAWLGESDDKECTRCHGLGHHPGRGGEECPECHGSGKCPKLEEGAEDPNDNWGVGDYVVTTWEYPNKYSEPLKVTGVHGDQVRVVDDYGNSELMSPNDLRLAPSNELSEGDEELPPIHAIARDIIKNWKKVNFGAVPYLDAMQSLSTKYDDYGADSGSSILAYGLSNMSHYSGRSVHDPELAKKHRAQLKQHLKEGIDLSSIVDTVLEDFPGQPKNYVDPWEEADQREMADDMDDDFEKDYIDPEIEDEELGLRFD